MDVNSLLDSWPVFVGFITLVIVLAKMHLSIETHSEKIKTLFELFNNKFNK
tara:strand:- start:136 stop:288 length:153 start_codon:yes stop_codon:yes gene_type:complete